MPRKPANTVESANAAESADIAQGAANVAANLAAENAAECAAETEKRGPGRPKLNRPTIAGVKSAIQDFMSGAERPAWLNHAPGHYAKNADGTESLRWIVDSFTVAPFVEISEDGQSVNVVTVAAVGPKFRP